MKLETWKFLEKDLPWLPVLIKWIEEGDLNES